MLFEGISAGTTLPCVERLYLSKSKKQDSFAPLPMITLNTTEQGKLCRGPIVVGFGLSDLNGAPEFGVPTPHTPFCNCTSHVILKLPWVLILSHTVLSTYCMPRDSSSCPSFYFQWKQNTVWSSANAGSSLSDQGLPTQMNSFLVPHST